jgi:hypothetical protein
MSAAIDFPPVVYVPDRARPRRGLTVVPAPVQPGWAGGDLCDLQAVPLAPLLALPWRRNQSADPLRLTRRGRLASVLAVVALSLGLVGVAWLSAPPSSARPATAVPASVVVHPGDTLWAVAREVAPSRDPRNVVDDLVRINRLSSETVFPGEVLRTR